MASAALHVAPVHRRALGNVELLGQFFLRHISWHISCHSCSPFLARRSASGRAVHCCLVIVVSYASLLSSAPVRHALTEATALIGLLAERFPNCFTLHEAKRSPLKINIAADILAALAGAISRRKLGYALSYYTHSNGYLAHMRAGAARIDLDGNTAGEVSPEHAGHAAERLTARTRNPAPRDLAKAKPPASKRITLADLREAAKRRDARP